MKLILPIILSLFIIMTIPGIYAESVPDWVKNTAGWWATDAISEKEFVNAIEFLANDGIIVVESINSSKSSESVPDWVKNTAGWWATDAISEKEFVNAIEFLIENSVITLVKDCKFYEDEYLHLGNTNRWFEKTGPHYESQLKLKEIFCDVRYTEDYFKSKQEKTQVNYQINSHSFRGDEFSLEKPDNTFRIFVVGGSTVQGWGVTEQETISNILQKELNELSINKKFEVINAGFGGAWSKDEVKLVENKIIKFNPDLIIVYDGWNDALKQIGNQIGYDSDATVKNWKDRWEDTCELSKQYDTPIIISLQPTLYTGEKLVWTDYERALYVEFSIEYHNSILEILEEYSKVIDEFETCDNVVDLRNIFDDTVIPLYIDSGHIGPEGNHIIASKFLELSLPIINEKTNEIISYNEIKRTNEINQQVFQNDFTGKYFEFSEFLDENIDNVDFKGAQLKDAKFEKAIIDNTNFRFSVFSESDILDSKINNSNFPRSVFYNTNLYETLISNSYFSGVQLEQVNFDNCEIDNTIMNGMVGVDSVVIDSEISQVDISSSVLQNMMIKNSELEYVKFYNSKIFRTTFEKVVFDNVDFSYSTHAGTVFKNSQFSNVDFTQVDFTAKGDKIENFMPGPIFYNSIFKNPNFNSAIFSNFDADVIDPEARELSKFLSMKIENSEIVDVDFSNTKFDFVSFKDSNLSNTNFYNSSLKFTNLEGANLEGANLEGANLEGANLNCINHEICIKN